MGEFSPSSSRASSPTPSLPHGRNNPYEGFASGDHYYNYSDQPPPPAFSRARPQTPTQTPAFYRHPNESETRLLNYAHGPAEAGGGHPVERWWSGGYGPVQQEDPGFTSYDYFRGRR